MFTGHPGTESMLREGLRDAGGSESVAGWLIPATSIQSLASPAVADELQANNIASEGSGGQATREGQAPRKCEK